MSDFSSSKAIFFDLMGTCVDWHTSITKLINELQLFNDDQAVSHFALAWRQNFFEEILKRFRDGVPEENIDITHRRVLDRLLLERGLNWDSTFRNRLVQGWHDQKGILVSLCQTRD